MLALKLHFDKFGLFLHLAFEYDPLAKDCVAHAVARFVLPLLWLRGLERGW